MKNRKMKAKHLLGICMAVTLGLVCVLGSGASAAAPGAAVPRVKQENASRVGGAAVSGKDEIVYARLTPDGGVSSIYTVNHFALEKSGTVEDYGEYSSVTNLTNTDQIDQSGDTVSFQTNEDNYYYQGNMVTTDLPWIFDIAYYLDGKDTAPRDIAGKDGKLELRITLTQNENVDATFYDNYMLQISVTLDTAKCGNIDAPDGTLASAGKDTVVAFTVLPGNDADFALTADVQDFEMTGISVSGVPYSMSMDFPDMDDQLEDLEKLPEAIAELNDGVAELQSGTQDMKDGAGSLVSGSAGIQSGLAQLSGNSGQLKSASSQINDALSKIASALGGNNFDEIDLSQVSQLPSGLTQMADGLRKLSDGLVELKDGYAPSYAALNDAIQGIPDAAVTEEQIGALYMQVDPSQHGVLDQLAANYAAAQRVKGTYAQVGAAFAAVEGAIGTMTDSLGGIADSLDTTASEVGGALGQLDGLDQLGDLISGLQELSSNYGSFHSGLVSYLDGVDTLASNYGSFHSGLAAFSSGVSELDGGIGELHDGTGTMSEEVADMPDMIQEEIDKMKEDYMPSDFDAVSFTSPRNTDTEFVQFVLQTDGIEKPDEEEAAVDEEPEETFWDRLKALFTS